MKNEDLEWNEDDFNVEPVIITAEVAHSFMQGNYIDGDGYEHCDVSADDFVVPRHFFDGFEKIDDEAAELLGDYNGHMQLNNVDELSVASTIALCRNSQSLHLPSLKEITHANADVFGDYKGERLYLGGQICEVSARHLSRCQAALSLCSFLSQASAMMLCDYGGYSGPELRLRLNQKLSDDLVKELIKSDTNLVLDIVEVSDSVANILSKKPGYLCGLHIAGAIEISDRTARYLSRFEGARLSLDVQRLTTKAANYLRKFDGELVLDELCEMSDGVAFALSKHRGRLSLNRLEGVTDKQEKYLAKHKNLVQEWT